MGKQNSARAGDKFKGCTLSILLASMFSLFAGASHAAAIKIMCDSPLEPALTKVADLFRQETNNQVTLACNPGPAIKKRIEGGEIADVAVVEPDFVEELTSSGKVRAGDRPCYRPVVLWWSGLRPGVCRPCRLS
jgi:molybdate transport system substrate-binding protein